MRDFLFENFDSYAANQCIFMMTQTFLAEFYINEFKKHYKQGSHLLDDGSYIIKIDTKRAKINVEKDFKDAFIDGTESYIIDLIKLYITTDLDTMNLTYIWKSEFNKNSGQAKTIYKYF